MVESCQLAHRFSKSGTCPAGKQMYSGYLTVTPRSFHLHDNISEIQPSPSSSVQNMISILFNNSCCLTRQDCRSQWSLQRDVVRVPRPNNCLKDRGLFQLATPWLRVRSSGPLHATLPLLPLPHGHRNFNSRMSWMRVVGQAEPCLRNSRFSTHGSPPQGS